uniref:Uncharacterized protein n=1 Tax=Anguilla anguilla TaxID=7936 RepID=A0A0E9R5W8_ANGAN
MKSSILRTSMSMGAWNSHVLTMTNSTPDRTATSTAVGSNTFLGIPSSRWTSRENG